MRFCKVSSQYLQIQPEQKLWARTQIAADGTEEESSPQPLLRLQLSSVLSLPASSLSAFSSIHRAEVSVHPSPQDNA